MNFSLMGNLLNWQTWELCLGKAPIKNISRKFKEKDACLL